jgi:hypothetical protein
MSTLSRSGENTPPRPNCVADDAVSGEPVCTFQIPFNWEKYWEFWKIDPVQSAHTFPSCNQQLLLD